MYNMPDDYRSYMTDRQFDEYDQCPNCQEREVKDKSIASLSLEFRDLLSMLYGKEPLNVAVLDNILDELSAIFDIKMPQGLPTIQRVGNVTSVGDVIYKLGQKSSCPEFKQPE